MSGEYEKDVKFHCIVVKKNRSLKEFLSVLTQLNICNMDFISGNTEEIRPSDVWHNYEKEIKAVADLINSFKWE